MISAPAEPLESDRYPAADDAFAAWLLANSRRERLDDAALAARLHASRRTGAHPVLWVLVAGLSLVMAAGVALLAMVAAVAAAPPATTVSVSDGTADLALTGDITVAMTGWDARIEQASLVEVAPDSQGRPGVERRVPLQGSVLRQSRWPEGTEVTLRPAEGALRPDAQYRLSLQTSALVAALPWPEPALTDREIRFSTVRSPVPAPQASPARLGWQQPLLIQWDTPIADVRYDVTPPTPIRTALEAGGRASSVVLESPDDGQTYTVAVVAARGVNGVALARPASYQVVAPTRPRLADTDESPTVELGTPLMLRWNVPVGKLELALDPPAGVRWEVDRRDPTGVQVSFDGLAQGTAYELTVANAVSRDGAPMASPTTITFETPERLMVDDLETGAAEGVRVSVKSRPILSFTQPIRDRKAALAGISIEPNVPGRWEWLDDRRAQFSPSRELPYDSEVTIKVWPGPDSARATNGAYFENQAVLAFRTEVDKVIDVDVTRQIMTLYERGRQVTTFPVATGLPGADTPLGEFTVEYKMEKARFQGTNVSGQRYDIPDVHWILAFMGDYTIHGAYWRSGFGVPASNGCVSMFDEDAKRVFDWAPEGTRIKIHY